MCLTEILGTIIPIDLINNIYFSIREEDTGLKLSLISDPMTARTNEQDQKTRSTVVLVAHGVMG